MMKKNLVVLTGAGISAESGLKTFRDSDGLWMGHDIYDVASPRGWAKDPALVLDFYNKRRQEVGNAMPNAAHYGLAKLEAYFNVIIITQNIDDLHERAGSTNVIHLHGEIFKMRSEKDSNNIFDIKKDILHGDLAHDGHQLRPHVVWFEEEVPMILHAKKIMRKADVFSLIGTSLQVYPAAGLIDYVPDGVTKFIIDKKIPSLRTSPDYIFIEETATIGITTFMKHVTAQI